MRGLRRSFGENMKISCTYILLIILSFAHSIRGIERKTIDNIVVTGEVKNIKLCQQQDKDVWIYRLYIQLHAKNIGLKQIYNFDRERRNGGLL